MPSFCAVVNCNDRYGHSENISFHKFPLKRQHLLEKWEAFIQNQRGKDWHASRWSSLCSRHFKEEDFRSLNERRTLKKTAVPTILGEVGTSRNADKHTPKNKKTFEKFVEPCETTRDKEIKEILAIKERLEDGVEEGLLSNVPKSNCRLCGIASIPAADLLNSYEIYGLLQKCFPNLSIQQEDALPKVICGHCHKNLEQFGNFVDLVWAAQTELQRKFRSKAVERPVKIKQEPLVRVKQEVGETGYEENQDTNGLGCANEDCDGGIDSGVHEEGDDQKYEFCDFPNINDYDIMEIINLDDPFINIPDDDNPTTVNDEEELLQKPIQDPGCNNYMPTAHELLQSHFLMEEHNYAYVDAEAEFKEETQIYKTEKSENDERLTGFDTLSYQLQHQQLLQQPIENNQEQQRSFISSSCADSLSHKTAGGFERRALKPIVTSVSAIQQPTKSSSNGIVVLNESIVKSGCGFQLHACMVCQLKFFSVENLKEHYTQTHGTPMVTVPSSNILFEKLPESQCKMEKEYSESVTETSRKRVETITNENNSRETVQSINIDKETNNNLKETKQENPENLSEPSKISENNNTIVASKKTRELQIFEQKQASDNAETVVNKTKKRMNKVSLKYRKFKNVSLHAMANQYQQLRKLYQKLQKKCLHLEENVEQLQSMPKTKRRATPRAKPYSVKKVSSSSHNTGEANNMCTKSSITPTNTVIHVEESKALKKFAYQCLECSKSFSNANSLRQHKISHTDERKHLCSLCQRSFKRRNGLLQHLKGFHLNVKPYSCPVCNHSYALKCDMQRCKHSTLRSLHAINKY